MDERRKCRYGFFDLSVVRVKCSCTTLSTFHFCDLTIHKSLWSMFTFTQAQSSGKTWLETALSDVDASRESEKRKLFYKAVAREINDVWKSKGYLPSMFDPVVKFAFKRIRDLWKKPQPPPLPNLRVSGVKPTPEVQGQKNLASHLRDCDAPKKPLRSIAHISGFELGTSFGHLDLHS